MKKFSRIIQGFAVVVGFLFLATSGQAAIIYSVTTPGVASVSVDAGLTTLSITLTDLYVDPTSVIQNISGFVFSTTGGSASSGPVSPNPAATYINVATNGSISSGSGTAVWGYSGTSTQYVLAWDGAGATGTQPAYTIIGDHTGSSYPAGPGSIAGNGPHNPFIFKDATFVLNIAGVTGITSGTIMFGTEWDTPPPPSVLEASALVLFSTGIVGLVVWRRKKRLE